MKLSQIKPSTRRSSSFLLISPQGVGKTIAAASFPRPRVYDLEGKIDSLITWYNQPEFSKQRDQIDVVVVNDILYFVYNTLEDMVNSKSRPDCDTIVVDSITNASRDIVNVMLSSRKKMPVKDGKIGGDRAKIVPGNIIVPSWDEFDAEDTVLGTMLGYLITLQKKWNINIVCIAHPHSVSGPNGTQQGRIVAKGHKAPQTVLNYFQEIYHLDRDQGLGGKVRRIALTQGGLYSRTAWGFLPAVIDFTDKSLYEVIKKKLDDELGGGQDAVEKTAEEQIRETQPELDGPQDL